MENGMTEHETLEARMTAVEDNVQQLNHILHGDDGMSGLLSLTIRLDERMKGQTKMLAVILSGVVALIIQAVASWLI